MVEPRTPDALIERWVRPEIRAISAYPVANAAGYIKLDAMENPYRWPPELVEAWMGKLRVASVNRYPDPQAGELKSALRAWTNLPARMDLLLGNGSDEIIQMLAMVLGGPGRTILAPEPTFVMYRMIAAFTGSAYVGVPLKEDFTLDRPAMLEAIERHRPSIVFLAYPNNPTGNLFDGEAITAILDAAPGVVVLDEAYHAFAERSFLEQLPHRPNLLVMRTLSKWGLAGLRLGFLAGAQEWLSEIDKVRLPYNINVLTQLSVEFALRHAGVFDDQTRRIRQERERLSKALSAISGVRVFPSAANFLLFRVDAERADDLFGKLKARRILIKSLHRSGGSLRGCLRVTVGTPDENDAFLAALRQILTEAE